MTSDPTDHVHNADDSAMDQARSVGQWNLEEWHRRLIFMAMARRLLVGLFAGILTLSSCTKSSEEKADTNEPEQTPDTSAVQGPEISTSGWVPGDGGRDALIGGTLGFNRRGCPHLGPGDRSWVIWPAGFAVEQAAGGEFRLITADGRRLKPGVFVRASGAAYSGTAGADMPCIPKGVATAQIESAVETGSPR